MMIQFPQLTKLTANYNSRWPAVG